MYTKNIKLSLKLSFKFEFYGMIIGKCEHCRHPDSTPAIGIPDYPEMEATTKKAQKATKNTKKQKDIY